MDKFIYILFASLLMCFGFSDVETIDGKKKCILKVEAKDCDNVAEMFLYEFNGMDFQEIQNAEKEADNTFLFTVKKSDRKFYYVGPDKSKFKSVILGEEDEVVMGGSCRNFKNAGVATGINADYAAVMSSIQKQRNNQIQLGRQFASVLGDEAKMNQVKAKMKIVDDQKMELLNASTKKDPWLGKIVALYTYLSYPNNTGNFKHELEYFVNTYGTLAKLEDKAYDNLPMVFDSYRNFAQMLAKAKSIPATELEKAIGIRLKNIPENAGAYRLALGGIISGLKAGNSQVFLPFAEMYVQKFGNTPQGELVKQQIKQMESFVVGGEAPDFTLKNLEDQDVSLSDFRGKVLLVDFWASWCGPCRKENPHVRKLYARYKEQGFEILGVSLDKTKDRWQQAVTKDKLEWEQVSDLAGWGNTVAKMYNVRSIPHTILLDEEGRILARNLRGPDLDKKLKEIFAARESR